MAGIACFDSPRGADPSETTEFSGRIAVLTTSVCIKGLHKLAAQRRLKTPNFTGNLPTEAQQIVVTGAPRQFLSEFSGALQSHTVELVRMVSSSSNSPRNHRGSSTSSEAAGAVKRPPTYY